MEIVLLDSKDKLWGVLEALKLNQKKLNQQMLNYKYILCFRNKRNKSQSSDSVFNSDPWSSSNVGGLEQEMSSLSMDRSSKSFEPSHTRSHSGGYVNLALSQSMEDKEPPLEELNMSTALATIKVLAKKAKQSKMAEDSQSCNMSVVSTRTTASRAISIVNGKNKWNVAIQI